MANASRSRGAARAAPRRRRPPPRPGRSVRGSPMASPTSAPTRVMAFHSTKTPSPVTQKPSRPAARLGWPDADRGRLVDGELGGQHPARSPDAEQCATPGGRRGCCGRPATSTWRWPPPRRAGPPAMIPTKANCEPPENSSSESAWVCQMLSPAATESAPKLMPYAPVATATDRACRSTWARRSRHATVLRWRSHDSGPAGCGGLPRRAATRRTSRAVSPSGETTRSRKAPSGASPDRVRNARVASSPASTQRAWPARPRRAACRRRR